MRKFLNPPYFAGKPRLPMIKTCFFMLFLLLTKIYLVIISASQNENSVSTDELLQVADRIFNQFILMTESLFFVNFAFYAIFIFTQIAFFKHTC